MTLAARLVNLAVRRRQYWPAVRVALRVMAVEVPRSVEIEPPIFLPHNAPGLVVHPDTRIGKNVKLYQGVTIGRSDIWRENTELGGGVVIEEGAIICPGAKILFRQGEVLTVGRGAVVGANAVLTKSVGAFEIWAGVPATQVGYRDQILEEGDGS